MMTMITMRRLQAFAGALVLSWSFPAPAANASTENDSDRQECIKQLEKVHQAIQAYRRDHKDLPNWLSDLVPKYITDTNLLVCPVTRRTGRTHAYTGL